MPSPPRHIATQSPFSVSCGRGLDHVRQNYGRPYITDNNEGPITSGVIELNPNAGLWPAYFKSLALVTRFHEMLGLAGHAAQTAVESHIPAPTTTLFWRTLSLARAKTWRTSLLRWSRHRRGKILWLIVTLSL